MPLLVSVRSAEEVAAALGGGADIIDAKEPARGSLGAVDREVLSRHRRADTSVDTVECRAWGFATEEVVRCAVTAARLPERSGPVYLKLGFAGTASAERVASLLRAAVETAAASVPVPGIVGVAYADHGAAGTLVTRAPPGRHGGGRRERSAGRYLREGWPRSAGSPPAGATLRACPACSSRRPALRRRRQPRSCCDLPGRPDRRRPGRAGGRVPGWKGRHGERRARGRAAPPRLRATGTCHCEVSTPSLPQRAVSGRTR